MIQFHMLELILSQSGHLTLEAGFYMESLFTDTGFIIELLKNFFVEYVILSRSLTSHFTDHINAQTGSLPSQLFESVSANGKDSE